MNHILCALSTQLELLTFYPFCHAASSRVDALLSMLLDLHVVVSGRSASRSSGILSGASTPWRNCMTELAKCWELQVVWLVHTRHAEKLKTTVAQSTTEEAWRITYVDESTSNECYCVYTHHAEYAFYKCRILHHFHCSAVY